MPAIVRFTVMYSSSVNVNNKVITAKGQAIDNYTSLFAVEGSDIDIHTYKV